MEERINYFAYGSNMDLQNLERLRVKLFKIQKAVLKDYQLIFNIINEQIAGAGYANIVPLSNSLVEGIIITTDEVSIQNLDKYECFPFLYQKKFLTVIVENNQPQEVLVYVGNLLKTRAGLLPTEGHLKHILEGKFFLSKEYWGEITKIKRFK